MVGTWVKEGVGVGVGGGGDTSVIILAGELLQVRGFVYNLNMLVLVDSWVNEGIWGGGKVGCKGDGTMPERWVNVSNYNLNDQL
jgi:hypothetical protein